MQVRLKVQRVHLAAIASLEYWRDLLGTKEAEYEIAVKEEIDKLLPLKTWCGGFKWNEASARRRVTNPPFEYYYTYSHLRHMRAEISRKKEILETVEYLAEVSTDKHGFMMLLTQEQYNYIWTEI